MYERENAQTYQYIQTLHPSLLHATLSGVELQPHQLTSFEMIQRDINAITTYMAIRHDFKLPDPIPNAWAARLPDCAREFPKEENALPCKKFKIQSE